MPIPENLLSDDCIQAALGNPPKGRSIQVLKHAWLDRWFARAHPALPAIVFLPVILSSILYAVFQKNLGGLSIAGYVALGFFAFTLVEYLLHRFSFHRNFGEKRVDRINAFLTHGYHHVYPNDPGRLVMPLLISLPLGALSALFYYWLFPISTGASLYAGFVAGYVTYDSFHYWLHHSQPTSQLGRFLKKYHWLHHYDDINARFGVSSPLWDVIFRTYAPLHVRQERPISCKGS